MELVGEGSAVVVVGRNAAHVGQVIADLDHASGAVLGLTLDVGCEEDMEEMRQKTLERFGQIDILVAAAGVMRGTNTQRLLPYAAATMPIQEWDEVLKTNLRGVFLSNRAVIPTMIAQRRGWIINISSSRGGLYGNPYASAYCASKFGVIGLSESLADELCGYGVKVHVVLPDVVDTPILGKFGRSRLGQALPPSRIAEFIVHLVTLPEEVILLNPLIAPFLNLNRPIGLTKRVRQVGRITQNDDRR